MAWSLGIEDRQELRKQFLALDTENQGTIKLHQLRSVLEENFHIESSEAKQLFQSLDADGDDELSYSEFLAAAATGHVHAHNDVLFRTFRRFDQDNSGVISVENLRTVLGDTFEGTDVEDLLNEADP